MIEMAHTRVGMLHHRIPVVGINPARATLKIPRSEAEAARLAKLTSLNA